MYVVCVTVWVKAGHERDFIEATLENARNTRQEPANLRFDVSQSADDPTRFLIYEVYRTPDGFKAHQQTGHYARWRDTVAPWMDQPRQGIKHKAIFPQSEAAWKAEC